MPSTTTPSEPLFFDAGMFIAGILEAHPHHAETRPLVEAARQGYLRASTSASVLSEVYAALTWAGTSPQQPPAEAARLVRALVTPASAIRVLECNLDVLLKALDLSARHQLTARRSHDARHAAAALVHGIHAVYTLDVQDWLPFEQDGLVIAGPPSALSRLARLHRTPIQR
ncbi:MAG: type II toxin-antitoxin system VapC family toxin [Planctomycetes bacterium]|nr:type II toxin-antitoxin system VapC family toxin [Planctomycetota bacterium]